MNMTEKMMSPDPAERHAAMAARIHRLSDPLAAMGQRSHQPRIQRESRWRTALLAITLTATLALTGAIAAISDPPDAPDAGIAYEPESGQQVHIRSKSS